jgi:hypothetical protein
MFSPWKLDLCSLDLNPSCFAMITAEVWTPLGKECKFISTSHDTTLESLASIDGPQDFSFLTNVKDVMYAFTFLRDALPSSTVGNCHVFVGSTICKSSWQCNVLQALLCFFQEVLKEVQSLKSWGRVPFGIVLHLPHVGYCSWWMEKLQNGCGKLTFEQLLLHQ